MSHQRRRITLCADDFALDEDASSAILELAERGRISAVTCATATPLWADAGRQLLKHRDRVMMGLHFNLTQADGETRSTLHRTILAAVARRLDPTAISAALTRQIERFKAVTGHLPDFIDGHEHVHAFPVIAPIVARVAATVSPEAPIPVRSLSHFFGPTDAPLKRVVIRGLAALGRRDTTKVASTPLNSGFAGDYSLRASADYARLFESWLEAAPDGALIVCHPRRDTADKPTTAGAQEFRFLDSPALTSLLDRHSIRFLRRDELDAGAFPALTSILEHA